MLSQGILDDMFLNFPGELTSHRTGLLNLHRCISVLRTEFTYLHLSIPVFAGTTKRLEYWDMEDKTLKRSRTEREEEKADTDSRAAKKTFLHLGFSSESGTGWSSYSQFLQPGTFLEPLYNGIMPSYSQFLRSGLSSELGPGSSYSQFLHPQPFLEPLHPCMNSSYSQFLQPRPLPESLHLGAKSSYSQFLQPGPSSRSLHLGDRPSSEPLHLCPGSSYSHFLQPNPFLEPLYLSTGPLSEPLHLGIPSSISQFLQSGPSSQPLHLGTGSSYSEFLQLDPSLEPLHLGTKPFSSEPLHLGTGSSSSWFGQPAHISEPLRKSIKPPFLGTGSSYSRFLQPGPSSESLGIGLSCSSDEGSVNKKFDVFICHRGPDTKQTLAYHLYDVLCLKGVKVFLDREELQSGETLTEAIKEALACSDVHVCILSSRFAESPWCLRELVMMLQKQDMDTCTLIPIFYNVEPADVRHLKGEFGQGFEKLKSKGRYSSEDIDQWGEALCKIAEIKGYQGRGELCRTIVNRICKLLNVGSIVSSGEKIVGIETQLLSTIDDITRRRQNGLGVTLVEISGVKGIGKTTFAKELYNKIYTQYQRCCFIEDVNGLAEKSGVNEVHKQLLSHLFKDKESYSSEIKKHLWKRLQNEEIVLVLDNIHRKLPLSTVFIENVSLSPSSTIIVTCREKGLLKQDHAVIDLYRQNLIELKIPNLDFFNSKKIFCRYAFAGSDHVKDEFNELVNDIVKKCHGIPLVLASIGSGLYEKDTEDWKYLWFSVKSSLPSEVKEILKFIYDNLTELEKCLFLDVATIFRWEKEELLVELRQSDDEDGKVQYALDALKKNLLIHVDCNGILHMHDVFVDLGRSIVKDEDKCPGRRSRVWHPSHVKYMLSYETGTEKVKALSLVSKGLEVILDDDEYPWSTNAFSKMTSLEILILHGHCIEGDFSKLSRRLLWLKWTNFPFKEIPRELCLKHVRVLHVSGEKMKRLWKHPPQEAPSKLRDLNLQHCTQLQRLPKSMGKLRQLPSINLYGCTSLKIIPDSFGQLQGLKHLQFHGCHALERLPKTFRDLTSLCTLKIQDCFAVVSLPEFSEKLLHLSSISLYGCRSLKIIPNSFSELQGLKNLELKKCPALEWLPKTFGGLTSLSTLIMEDCFAMVSLPEFSGKLLQLSSVYLHGCTSLKIIPNSFGELQGLKNLELKKCHALEQLPKTFGYLTRLCTLKIEDCFAVGSLPDFSWKLLHLSSICLDGCTSLKSIPASFGQLQGLEDLNLYNCRALQQLPETFGHLNRLSSLSIRRCPAMISLPESFGDLRSLSQLCIQECPAMVSLPKSVGKLLRLQRLHISYCDAVEGLPQSFGCSTNFVQAIQIKQQRDTPNFLSAPNNETETELEFQFIGSASGLPCGMCELKLEGFWKVQLLPQSLCNLRHLVKLDLCYCYSLLRLPDSIGSLSFLEDLSVIWCLNLEELDPIGNLQNLRLLRIFNCLALKELLSCIGNLSSLECLMVKDCWMMEVIHTQALSSLSLFHVEGCVNLSRIVGLSNLSNLKFLRIRGCLKLREIMVSAGCFNRLTELQITGCYQLIFTKGLAEHFPPQVYRWQLSLNHNHFDTKTLPAVSEWSLNATAPGGAVLNVKTSPALFLVVEQKIRTFLDGCQDQCFFLHKLTKTQVPSLPFIPRAAMLCFISAVYTADLPRHVPPPKTDFEFYTHRDLVYDYMDNFFFVHTFRRSDCGEEIHLAVFRSENEICKENMKRCDGICVEIDCQLTEDDDMNRCYDPSCEATVKDGWIIYLGHGKEFLATEIHNIFYSELRKQRLMSRAWTELPSQLHIHEFSALDIAGCQITKISRHCDTFIMEEESGLIWSKRRCLFMDDHALLLHHTKGNEHSFLAYPEIDGDLETAVANLYEMSISILIKGKVVSSRKLQQINPITEEEIPPRLSTLFQGRAFHFPSETMRRMKLWMLERLKVKSLSFER